MANKLTNMDISKAIYEGYKLHFNEYMVWDKDEPDYKLDEWLRLGQDEYYYDGLFLEISAAEIIELKNAIRIEYGFDLDVISNPLMARVLAIMGLYYDGLAERIVKYYK
jgi:hypothetical protein|nr:MAG TPA: hypothetical protein [Bacteriophage sp.]